MLEAYLPYWMALVLIGCSAYFMHRSSFAAIRSKSRAAQDRIRSTHTLRPDLHHSRQERSSGSPHAA